MPKALENEHKSGQATGGRNFTRSDTDDAGHAAEVHRIEQGLLKRRPHLLASAHQFTALDRQDHVTPLSREQRNSQVILKFAYSRGNARLRGVEAIRCRAERAKAVDPKQGFQMVERDPIHHHWLYIHRMNYDLN